MAFAHRRLTVYQRAIEVVAAVAGIARTIHKIDPWLASQIRRAAASIALNIAEGAGEYSKAEKARFYRIARRSALELSAALDVAIYFAQLDSKQTDQLNSRLDEIAAMLTTMTKNLTNAEELTNEARPLAAPPRLRPRPRPRPRPRS